MPGAFARTPLTSCGAVRYGLDTKQLAPTQTVRTLLSAGQLSLLFQRAPVRLLYSLCVQLLCVAPLREALGEDGDQKRTVPRFLRERHGQENDGAAAHAERDRSLVAGRCALLCAGTWFVRQSRGDAWCARLLPV